MATTTENTDFPNEPIEALGKLVTSVACSDWNCECISQSGKSGQEKIIGRDIFNSLGLAVAEQKPKDGKWVKNR